MLFATFWDKLGESFLASVPVILGLLAAYIDLRRRALAADTTRTAQGKQLETVAADVRKVELATNSMKDQLVQKTEAEALARGGVEERARADQRDSITKGPP